MLGFPRELLVTSIDLKVTGPLNPVPRALAKASFAANRLAKNFSLTFILL